jgi:hypothetical protein
MPAARPTPAPTRPLATPPPVQELPGGGQAGIVDAAAPPPPPPDVPKQVVNRSTRSHRERPAPARAEGPVSLARLLAWADPGSAPTGALWPAHRLVDMHGPDGPSADRRMTAFSALWRATLDELLEQLVQQFAWRGSGVVGFARPGSEH